MKKNTLKDGLDAKKDAKRDAKSSFCCSVSTQSNDPKDQQTNWEQEEVVPTSSLIAIGTTTSKWYDHIKFFLHNRFPPETLDPRKRRALRLKSAPYQLINDVLFRNNYDGVFLKFLEKIRLMISYFNFMQDL